MGIQIEGGSGNGYAAAVDSENRLTVAATMQTREHEINHHNGQSYSYGVSVTPTGAGDCFLYLKNHNDIDMIVSEFMLRAATNETITFKLGDTGTPIGGSTGTPVNRNAGSGNEADVTALYGVDITGLAGGSAVMSMYLNGGDTSVRIAPLSGFIIPKNKTITGYVTTGGIAVMIGMGISFHRLI